jgi:peptidyl-prolyl cis-trans isomerase SurA
MKSPFVWTVSLSLIVAVPVRAVVVERVIAKVNGEVITLSEFEQRQLVSAQAANLPRERVPAYLQEKGPEILQDAIDELLLSQKADELGIRVRPEALDQVVEEIKKDNKITTEAQFKQELTREGLTLEGLKRNIERSISKRRVISREIESKVTVSEDEIRADYEAHPGVYRLKETVHLQEIVIKLDGAKSRALADDVAKRARGGEDFAELAKQHSTSPTRATGGELGRVVVEEMQSDLRRAIKGLTPGQVTDPVSIAGTLRILKVNEREEARTVPYEEARVSIEQRLRQERTKQRYAQYIEGLRKTAIIDIRVRDVPTTMTLPSASEPGILHDVPADTSVPDEASTPLGEPSK